MAKYIITPWMYHTDLLDVRRQLYHLDTSSPDERRHAVHRVMAWKMRGNLPHAVESTALLIDAVLHHTVPEVSTFSVRAVYSAAFTRFVTGFCDIGRNKERSLEPSSMLDIAKQIGMPEHFVALRHEATHEELPAMHRLIKATDEALQWLWNVYWSELEVPETQASIVDSLPQLKAEAKQILRDFRSARKDSLRSKKKSELERKVRDTTEDSLGLVGNSIPKMEAFAEVLVQEKLLSPSNRQLGDSLQGAFLIWDQLLQAIVKERRAFVRALVRSLLASVARLSATQADDAEPEAMAMWVNHILSTREWARCTSEAERSILCKDVIKQCCVHPSRWANWLGKELLEREGGNLEEEWRDVFEASQLGDAETQILSEYSQLNPGRSQEPGDASEVALPARTVDSSKLSGWTRLAVPPTTSIGVV